MRERESVVAAGSGGAERSVPPRHSVKRSAWERPRGLALYASGFTVMFFLLHLAYLGIRMSLTGYGPFANQHEFAVSFVLGIVGAYVVVEYLYRIRALSPVVLPIAPDDNAAIADKEAASRYRAGQFHPRSRRDMERARLDDSSGARRGTGRY